ncbi:hypothetical protein [Lentzea flaviverrucosa]|uniref:ABC-type transport system involved in multi-copper enzyme maturation, permease component n=1 Tax=Lentzea flaviverrucosa TaxID=200379 RepID=A0A1H9D4Z6_9PSEU|nr:hypothetical protein [Lentzea flaviverrucosa]RDI24747.1 hypothetical protein DFR72_109327 [Lentzea flaviverrucosa]SEQ08449.1 hypothetical protein SAMN05216195_101982 [Lentzea flaviverrucosa]
MTGLRIELRRSTALWAGLLVLVSGTGMLLLITSASSRWTANSTSAVLELRLPLAYVWALVVGLAVLQGMRDSRARVTELFTATSRPGWVRLGTLASAVAGVVAVAGALLCAGLVATVAFGGGFVSIGFVPLMVTAVLALASSVLLGLAVGRFLPHPLTVPVALVATFMVATSAGRALEVQSPGDEISRLALLTPVLDPPDSDLVTTSTAVDLGQIVWFTGLGVTAFLLLVARTHLGRLASLVPAGLAVVLALSIMPVKYSEVLVTDSIAGKLVCDGEVCLSQVHAVSLPVVAPVGRDVLAKLSVLPDAPSEVREDTSAMAHLTAPQRDRRIVYVQSQGFPRPLSMTGDQLRLELLAGAGIAGCAGPNTFDTSGGVVRYVTAGYFNGELAELASEPLMWNNSRLRGDVDEAWRQFRGQPAQEQLNRVVQARQMLLACEDSERVLDVLKASR